jgi:CTP synthase
LYPDASSAEIDETTPHPVIVYMPEISKTHLGGTMRLGLRPTLFNAESASWSKARALYGGADVIWERHRHRYEVGPAYVDRFVESGLEFIGKDEAGVRMQVFELKGLLCFFSDKDPDATPLKGIHSSSGCKLIQSFALVL